MAKISMVPKLCQYCGLDFLARAWNVAQGNGKFCSRTCYRAMKQGTPEQRFWEKVDKGGDCWLWTGATRGRGRYQYGSFVFEGRNPRGTHCIALELAIGRKLLRGEYACHTCDHPACVRNDEPGFHEINGILIPRWGHLFIGNPRMNAIDASEKGRLLRGDLNCRGLEIRRKNRNRQTRLVESDILEIRQRHAVGDVTLTQLSQKFRVSVGAIGRIVSRKVWAHL